MLFCEIHVALDFFARVLRWINYSGSSLRLSCKRVISQSRCLLLRLQLLFHGIELVVNIDCGPTKSQHA